MAGLLKRSFFRLRVFSAGLVVLGSHFAAAQDEGRVERGRALVQTRCEQCHAVGLTGASAYLRHRRSESCKTGIRSSTWKKLSQKGR